jgi:hypothetical protein
MTDNTPKDIPLKLQKSYKQLDPWADNRKEYPIVATYEGGREIHIDKADNGFETSYLVDQPNGRRVSTASGVTLRATKPFRVDVGKSVPAGEHKGLGVGISTTQDRLNDGNDNNDASISALSRHSMGFNGVTSDVMNRISFFPRELNAARYDGAFDVLANAVLGSDGVITDPKKAVKLEGQALWVMGIVAEKDGKPVDAPMLTQDDLIKFAKANLGHKTGKTK